MNQQAFSGGIAAPPFLPISLPSGVPTPQGIPGAPLISYGHIPNQHPGSGGQKDEQNEHDQVSQPLNCI